MAMMVHDTYEARDRRIFREGMRAIDDITRKKHGTGFVYCAGVQSGENLIMA